jgi:hypothetical protein
MAGIMKEFPAAIPTRDDLDAVQLVRDKGGKPIELRLKDAAAAKSVGFEPIPLEKIGVYEDPRRASWPVAHKVDSISLPHDG